MKTPGKSKLQRLASARRRKEAQSQGFYDGRFRQRVVKDKKKEASRKKCRGLIRREEKD